MSTKYGDEQQRYGIQAAYYKKHFPFAAISCRHLRVTARRDKTKQEGVGGGARAVGAGSLFLY